MGLKGNLTFRDNNFYYVIANNKFILICPCWRMKEDYVCLGFIHRPRHVRWAHTCCLQKGSLANLTNIEDFLNKHYNLHAFERKIDIVDKDLMQQSKIP